MSSVVLDASALIALLRDEPGSELVLKAVQQGACISAVNYSEVLKKLHERGDASDLDSIMREAEIDIEPFDAASARAAADLYLPTKEHGMSFADRACIALAIAKQRPLYTAERKMDQLGLSVRVRLLKHR